MKISCYLLVYRSVPAVEPAILPFVRREFLILVQYFAGSGSLAMKW